MHEPALEVACSVAGGFTWHERTIIEDTKHGFQVGKVCMSLWNNQAAMYESPVEFLDVGSNMDAT
jgi:hypothetical protein